MGSGKPIFRALDVARSALVATVALLALAATILVMLAALAVTPAGAAELPEKDPFYKAPGPGEAHENWREEAPGTVLRKRAITIYGYSAYQLLFRSNNARDEPIVAVTTVGIPRNPWTGLGERPMVSYQEAIDSLGSQCNPSYELQQGSDKEEGQEAAMLERGWYVNIPDHDGEDMEFVAGPNAAHITLDSIRAVYNASIGITTKNPLGLMGYSGGGETTAFAMEEQPTYAPDLHIAVAAPGGIPVELKEVAEYNNGGAGFGLVIAATIGIDRGFPELELYSLLNETGVKTFKEVEKKCLTEYESNPSYAFKTLSEYTKPEYPEPLTLPKVVNVIEHDSLGTAPGALNSNVPGYPTFIWQSATDELIPVAGVDRLANYYCSQGVYVDYDRGASGEHISYAVDQAPTAAAFMESVFNGAPAPETCGANASTNTVIDSGPSGQTTSSSATFTYSTEPESPGATFECKLDGGAFESCPASGVTYTGLEGGQHTFAVRSVTATGDADVSPATSSWTYYAVPAVSGIEPREGPLSGGTTVTITGANLAGASAVHFGSTPAASFTVNSPSSISAVSPAGSGSVDVTVTTPGGTSAATPADQFSYVAAPTFKKMTGRTGPVGGGTTVTITGTNFSPQTTVRFGSVPAQSVTVSSPTTLTAVSPAHAAGTVDVTVSTAGGSTATRGGDHFKFTPTISQVSPSSGSTAGGQSVTVTGAGFVSGATTIAFGGSKAKSVTCTSWDPAQPSVETTCTVSTPAHRAETVNVRATVNKAKSPASGSANYTYG
jgi:hypothetical protein